MIYGRYGRVSVRQPDASCLFLRVTFSDSTTRPNVPPQKSTSRVITTLLTLTSRCITLLHKTRQESSRILETFARSCHSFICVIKSSIDRMRSARRKTDLHARTAGTPAFAHDHANAHSTRLPKPVKAEARLFCNPSRKNFLRARSSG